MTTTTPNETVVGGHDLRLERERIGLTRVQLAARVGCSLTFLSNVEQGAVPQRSPTLQRVWTVLADLELAQTEDRSLEGERRPRQVGVATQGEGTTLDARA